ncbi:MAG TPA: DUF4824 family protein [Steroidobacteraceae bacterium]
MNLRSNRFLLISGSLLVCVANGIVFLGVLYNRHPPADSTLMLTERELVPSRSWSLSPENSGLDLQIEVRTPATRSGSPGESGEDEGAPPWGGAQWLSPEKLRSLGFPLASTGDMDKDRRRDEKLLARDVYLVLELNGNAYEHELQHAQEQATQDELLASAAPEDRLRVERAKYGRERADAERNKESRLFCIDAGLDPLALRQLYPDRAHYAIVRGTVRPYVYESAGHWRVMGRFADLRIPQLNVSLVHRSIFGASRNRGYADAIALGIAGGRTDREGARHYSVEVAWGRRLEPWILGATGNP